MKKILMLVVALLCVPVDGVTQERTDPLKGVTSVYPRVGVGWDDRITLKTESQYRRQAEDAFDLGLLRAGLRLDPESFKVLTCKVALLSSEGRVAYAWLLEFQEPVTRVGVQEISYGTTWSLHGVASSGVSNLDGARLGETCAEQFELAWRRANN